MIPDTPSIERLSDLLADRTPSPEPETEPPIPSDTVFSVLAHRHRRYALSYLLGRDGPVTVGAIIAHVVGQIESPEEGAYDRISLRFHHSHLPKLADAGLIEYDREEQIVAPTDATATVGPHLRLASA